MKQHNTILKFTITALFIALTYLATALVQIPIPLGYANLGDCIILTCAFFFSPGMACIAGAAGAAMADILTGYAIWAAPTVVVKTLDALSACLIFGFKNKNRRLFRVKTFAGAKVSMIVMTVGYTLFGALLYGSMESGLASAPGLAVEGVVNVVAFFLIGTILDKSGITKSFNL